MIFLGCLLLAACQGVENRKISSSRNHFLRPSDPPVIFSGDTTVSPDVDTDPSSEKIEEEKPAEEVYTISVTEMPVRDLLFALARDANKNIDVYPGINGRVTLSAVNQSLPQILDRVAKQVGIRYEFNDQGIVVSPDRPYLKIYQVDYVNISRESSSSNKISTQLSTNLGTLDLGGSSTSDLNQSQTTLTNKTVSDFWKNLAVNLKAILGVQIENYNTVIPSAMDSGNPLLSAEGAGVVPSASSLMGSSGSGSTFNDKPGIVSLNPEAGMLTIIATDRQHERIQEYLDTVLENVHRQVLIESTVVEVELSDQYQEGVDWKQISNLSSGFSLTGDFTSSVLGAAINNGTSGLLTLKHTGGDTSTGSRGAINAAIHMLENFGNTKVLSSPKIMAMNNQPAVLKVVKNRVFFTLRSGSTTSSDSGTSTDTSVVAQQPIFDTQIHTVPEGLVMMVTPQISEEGIVSLNVRPTITKISSWQNDPNPALASGNTQTGLTEPIINRIPEMEIKEMETMMRVHSGQVAVMGGLMQDSFKKSTSGVPLLSTLPGIGSLFGFKDQTAVKTELVVFLRPVVISHLKPKLALAAQNRRHSQDVASGKVANQEKAAPVSVEPTQNPVSHPSKVPFNAPPAATAVSVEPTFVAPTHTPAPYLDFTQPGGVEKISLRMSPMGTLSNPKSLNISHTLASENQPNAESILASLKEGKKSLSPAVNGPPSGRFGEYFIDLGSYQEPAYADEVHQRVAAIGLPTYRESATIDGHSFQRMRSGPFADQAQAIHALNKIVGQAGVQARVASY